MLHPAWLRQLVAPLLEPGVGASFGNRWFCPAAPTLGGLVRYAWNAAAVVPMTFLCIPRGGSMAIRRDAAERLDLVGRWSRAIVHDAPLRAAGLRVRFVPALMMVIGESCSLRFCADFVGRQLLWTRIDHPGWWGIALQMAAVSILWLAAGWVAVTAGQAGRWGDVRIILGAALSHIGILCGLLTLLNRVVWRLVSRQSAERPRWPWWAWTQLPLAVVVAHAVQAFTTWKACSSRRVRWRGVTYDLAGPWQVRLVREESMVSDTVGRSGESLSGRPERCLEFSHGGTYAEEIRRVCEWLAV